MGQNNGMSLRTLPRDLTAGMVVFLVALPLCLGIAMASGAPLFSGVVAGIIGGIIVGAISGSQTSVSGPGNTLMAIVAAQIAILGSFEALLLAIFVAGVIQLVLGIVRAGFIAAFFPTSVIKGLLAAIGIILIMKQIPHMLGHDTDPEGDLSFQQPDQRTTLTEFIDLPFDVHLGPTVIGLASILLLIAWDRSRFLKRSPIPAALVVVIMGGALSYLFKAWGGIWDIANIHLVQMPVARDLTEFLGFFRTPDFSQFNNTAIYTAALTIAMVASLESLLNLEAVDKIDPKRRNSPPSRELVAQGIGNMTAGLLGGLPITSVIVRSSVNITAGGQTKLSTIFHGVLLLVCALFMPHVLNMIPLSCLAAILFYTGLKLASPVLVRQMWQQGRYQFFPFAATVLAIVFTDLLTGILIGMAVSISFILNSNLRRPIRRFMEKHLGGDVLHIELANQVSFLNRAALLKVFDGMRRGGHLLLDATDTDYIDPDVLELIREFKENSAPARGVTVSLIGFRKKYQLEDEIQYVDYSTRELQQSMTPQQVLQVLREGNDRFRTGKRLTRDLGRQVNATAAGQHPLAVVLTCIDSRTPSELIFDLGVGDVFSVRVAGNIISRKVLGSMEYGCALAGAKLILVLGHTRCGAVTTAVRSVCSPESVVQLTGCQHVEFILRDIEQSIDRDACRGFERKSVSEQEAFIDEVARANVLRTVEAIPQQSETLAQLLRQGRIAIVGAIYDVAGGTIEFLNYQEKPAATLVDTASES